MKLIVSPWQLPYFVFLGVVFFIAYTVVFWSGWVRDRIEGRG